MALKVVVEGDAIGIPAYFPLFPKWISILIEHNIINGNKVIILNVVGNFFLLPKDSLPIDSKCRIVKVN